MSSYGDMRLPFGVKLVYRGKDKVTRAERMRNLRLLQAISSLIEREESFLIQEAWDEGWVLVRPDDQVPEAYAERERYRRMREQGLTIKQMAQREGVSEATVKRRLSEYRKEDPGFP